MHQQDGSKGEIGCHEDTDVAFPGDALHLIEVLLGYSTGADDKVDAVPGRHRHRSHGDIGPCEIDQHVGGDVLEQPLQVGIQWNGPRAIWEV